MNRMNELAAFLKTHDRYAVIGHVNPDGDAIGCAAAAVKLLHAMGKEAFAFLPGGMPVRYRKFECTIDVAGTPEEMPFEPETAFAVDVSAPDRMGCAEIAFTKAKARAVIDHHMTNPGFGDVCVVDGNAAACAEPLITLHQELGIMPDSEAGNWLLIALATDSGRFGYSSTRPQTYEAAAICVRAGADVDKITTALYRTRSAGHTRLLGETLRAMHIDETGRLCCSVITDEMYQRCGALREDSDGIVNYLLEIEGVAVACLAETRDGRTKLSLRSNGSVNVAELAREMGGGGHERAAGVNTDLSVEEAITIVFEKAAKVLEQE